MSNSYSREWPFFMTATIAGFKHLLEEDKYKKVIIDSLKHLVSKDLVNINAFVIMSNRTCLPAGRFMLSGKAGASINCKKSKIVL